MENLKKKSLLLKQKNNMQNYNKIKNKNFLLNNNNRKYMSDVVSVMDHFQLNSI